MIERIELTKLDVVKRQLLTSIHLFFNEEDSVSIHTLTASSYDILMNLSDYKKIDKMFVKNRYLNSLKKEVRNAFRKGLNEPQNFFKHADKDPESKISFAPLLTEVFLVDACNKYNELTNDIIPDFLIFEMWFMTKNPGCFEIPEKWKPFVNISKKYHQKNNTKGFYKEIKLFIQSLHLS